MLSWALAYVKPSLKSSLSERCVRLCSLSAKMAGSHKPKVLECSDAVASCAQFSICDTWQGSSSSSSGRAKKKTMQAKAKAQARTGKAAAATVKVLRGSSSRDSQEEGEQDFSWVFAYVPNARLQFSIMQLWRLFWGSSSPSLPLCFPLIVLHFVYACDSIKAKDVSSCCALATVLRLNGFCQMGGWEALDGGLRVAFLPSTLTNRWSCLCCVCIQSCFYGLAEKPSVCQLSIEIFA